MFLIYFSHPLISLSLRYLLPFVRYLPTLRTTQEDLVCYHRFGIESVPNCSGPGLDGKDYCVDRPPNYLFYVGNDGIAPNTLGLCEGDCDQDEQCIGSLVCFQRKGLTVVPGCDGEGRSGSDYCREPDPPDPTASPTLSTSPTATKAPVGLFDLEIVTSNDPLGNCQGDCDSDADCQV